MANYEGWARSNYVRFDPEKLKALAYIFPIETCENKDGLTCILSQDEFGTPDVQVDLDDEEIVAALDTLGVDKSQFNTDHDNITLIDLVHHAFAADMGGVFVWVWVGHEKLRYLDGGAVALDQTGEELHRISIWDMNQFEGVANPPTY